MRSRATDFTTLRGEEDDGGRQKRRRTTRQAMASVWSASLTRAILLVSALKRVQKAESNEGPSSDETEQKDLIKRFPGQRNEEIKGRCTTYGRNLMSCGSKPFV